MQEAHSHMEIKVRGFADRLIHFLEGISFDDLRKSGVKKGRTFMGRMGRDL